MLDTAGNETVLYTFTGDATGGNPSSNLILDAAGNLYGTARNVLFEINPAGRETVLYTFDGYTHGDLVRDLAGNLYGTTVTGGTGGYGVVYKLDPVGQETVLYNFTGGTDGGEPQAGVFLDAAGNLYGTTYYGGKYNTGVVFKVVP